MKHKLNRALSSRVFMYALLSCMLLILACSSGDSESSLDNTESASSVTDSGDGVVLTREQYEVSSMTMGAIEKHVYKEELSAIGSLDVPPGSRASVSSFYGGQISELNLMPGKFVRQGQVLLVLENPDLIRIQRDYLDATERQAYLESEYRRQQNLFQDSITSQKKYLQAKSEYKVNEVDRASLAKQLELMGISPDQLKTDNLQSSIALRAPISGYITDVLISRGEYLEPSQEAVGIVSLDELHLELNVYERDLPKIKKGQEVRFRLQSDASREHKAKVIMINKMVDPESRTITVHADVENKHMVDYFSPGMYAEASIRIASDSILSLPQEAVVESEGRHYALMFTKTENDRLYFDKRIIEPGLSSDSVVQILNAEEFTQGTRFLTSGAFNLITE